MCSLLDHINIGFGALNLSKLMSISGLWPESYVPGLGSKFHVEFQVIESGETGYGCYSPHVPPHRGTIITMTTETVKVLTDGGIFGFMLPAAHNGRWKPRRLEFGEQPRKVGEFDHYLRRKGHSETAMNNVAHALLSGIGLLFIWKQKVLINIIELV